MNELELCDVVDDALGPVNVRFGVGLNVCLGDSLPVLGRLMEIASGTRTPRRGRALRAGVSIRESPQARRKMACLLAEEELPAARELQTSLQTVLSLRESKVPAEKVLDAWGLGSYARVKPSRLASNELRAVQLALCLCETDSDPVLLHDPLGIGPLLVREHVVARCMELSRQRTVVIMTDRLSDAIAFGGNAYLLERGRLSSYAGLGSQRGDPSLRVRARDAQQLADALRADASLQVRFDAQYSKAEFSVSGESLNSIATSVTRIAAEQGMGIESLSAETPELGELLRARTAALSVSAQRRTRFWGRTKSE